MPGLHRLSLLLPFDLAFETIGVVPKQVLVAWFPWTAKRVFGLALSETLPALEQCKWSLSSETTAKTQHMKQIGARRVDPCSVPSAVALKLIPHQWATPEARPDLPKVG
jgi:hypothetical protein